MSHVATVNVVVKDLDCLEEAARRCGLEMVRGQKTYRWYGRHVGDYPVPAGFEVKDLGHCTHALRIAQDQLHPGNSHAYEVGVVARPDGTYALIWDFWARGHGLQDVIGDQGKTLINEYALQVAEQTARLQGWIVERNGLELTIYAGAGTIKVTPETVEAFNYQGMGCTSVTELLTQAMGVQVSGILKPEAHNQLVLNTVVEEEE
jgi:hypothetical protein